MFCTGCGTQIPDNSLFCTKCGKSYAASPQQAAAPQGAPVQSFGFAPPPAAQSGSQGMNFDFNTNTASAETIKRYEYKVLSQKDKWFSGKFDPTMLEQALNAYAQQGWRVVGCATADIPSFGTARQEFITLLEREVR